MDMPIQHNKAIVGRKLLPLIGHHQDGVLKNKDSYEIIDPKMWELEKNSYF